MTNELWNNYKKETNKQIEDLQLKIMKIQDIRNLNHYWNLIHKGIMNAAIKIIPNHMTPTQHKERKFTRKMVSSYKKNEYNCAESQLHVNNPGYSQYNHY
ncbi:2046_t:CDS:2 [Entrophospora sp. SA101]|nr:2046_t:CDS:2 [Entrophospora sp. SA101]